MQRVSQSLLQISSLSQPAQHLKVVYFSLLTQQLLIAQATMLRLLNNLVENVTVLCETGTCPHNGHMTMGPPITTTYLLLINQQHHGTQDWEFSTANSPNKQKLQHVHINTMYIVTQKYNTLHLIAIKVS